MTSDVPRQHYTSIGPVFMFAVLVLMACLSCVSIVYAQDVSVRAELSSSTITRDESVTLTITAIGIDAELDASSLARDFDVVGRSSSRQISTVIGSDNRAVNTSVVTWALELLPRGQGIFTVPAVKVGDLETQLLTLTVSEVPKGAARDVYLEAEVDTTTPWVQSQVVMTLRVFQAIDIVDGGLDVPEADDLVVERIGDDRSLRQMVDGREYNVTERRFAMFPQKSGPLTIEPITLSVTVPADPGRVRGFFSPTRKLTRRSDAITLDVQARPPSGAAWWLPAQNVSLSSQWQGDPDNAQVDQPLTRTLVLRAEGVLDSQLPEISIPAIDGLSLYAEDPKRGMGEGASGLISEQRINWALIPQRSGTLSLPAINIEWFNTLTGETEVAELPAESITVLASSLDSNSTGVAGPAEPAGDALIGGLTDNSAEISNSSATPAQTLQPLADSGASQPLATSAALPGARLADLETSVQRWRLFALTALGLWITSAIAWLVLRTRLSHAGNEQADRSQRPGKFVMANQVGALYRHFAPLGQVEAACKEGDLHEIKRVVLEWAGQQWLEDQPGTLDDVQNRLPPGAARQKLAQLQSALYSRSGYTATMPELTVELNTLAEDLKNALQQLAAEQDKPEGGGGNRAGSSVSKAGSRLPQL